MIFVGISKFWLTDLLLHDPDTQGKNVVFLLLQFCPCFYSVVFSEKNKLKLKQFPSPLGLSNLSMALEMFAKYTITITFSMMFAVTAELYPTLLRNTAVGICSTVGRLGNCITPYLITLSE